MTKSTVLLAVILGIVIGLSLGALDADWHDRRALAAPFADTVGHPYAEAIEEIRLAGLTAGCGPAMFCPDRPLTRGEFAVMLARLLP